MRFLCRGFWILVSAILGLMSANGINAAETSESLSAGAHAQDITPQKFPISVNGNMTDVQATAAHDPLYARCLVLKNAERSIAIVICDSCAIPRPLMDRAKTIAAKQTGIPVSNILISATHAHSCPTATPVFQSDPNEEYCDFLVEQIALGIERASNQAEPARVGWGSVELKSLLFNRRWVLKPDETNENPFGSKSDRVITNPGHANPKVRGPLLTIDPELSFISVQARDGRPIALMANYALHYIGGVPPNTVSADYFGEFARRIERQLKATEVQPPFVGMLSNGASGDVNNVDFRLRSSPQRDPFEQINYAAELLAQNVSKALEKVEYHEELPIKARVTEIIVGVRKPTVSEVKAAAEKLEMKTPPYKDLPDVYAHETQLLNEYPNSFRIILQAIQIGTLGIVTSPCETFAETGLDIKHNSPFKSTILISLANGYNGYLPPPEQLLAGGYETWRARSSYLAPDSEPKIRETIKKLLIDTNRR